MSKSTKEFIAQNNKFISTGTHPQDYTKFIEDGIGSIGIPNSKASIRKTKSEKSLTYPGALVYEAIYNFDENGLRCTPLNNSLNKKSALFFGDSQTFGEGLNDNQTLPFLFQKYSSDFNSFNFGFPGSGPTNMLAWLKNSDFQTKFKNVEGEVFFILRDDDIRKVNNLKDEITPNEYTEENFSNLADTFQKCKDIVSNISLKLNFSIVIIPLTFSYKQIIYPLINKGINVLNFYFIDLGYLTSNRSRFLDGVHSFESNNVLAKLISDNYQEGYNPVELFKNSITEDYNEITTRVEIESFFMHYFIDFPKDDAGVIIANILKLYQGTVDENKLFNISEKKYKEKIDFLDFLQKENIIPKNTYELFLTDSLTLNEEKLLHNDLFNSLSERYRDAFLKLYINLYR